ncbi:hypothetical protein JB92DRAFT_2801736 [Gautieria morchelliformis]|nr:hypothetical protein JB92DRAFT_2801736 [Gautieria morchelliformis]
MSLASLLLGGPQTAQSTRVDDELDELFLNNPRPLQAAAPNSIEASTPLFSNVSSPRTSHAKSLKRKRQDEASIDQPPTSTNLLGPKGQRGSKQRRPVIVGDDGAIGTSEEEAENDTLENQYISRRTTRTSATTPERKGVSGASVTDSSEVDDENMPPPLHETHTESGRRDNRSKSHTRATRASPDETPAQRDARTVFVGNVPVAVVKSKPLQKQLKRHFLSLITRSKIESIRFRSIAFASATAVLPTEDSKTSPSKKDGDAISTRQQRQEDRAAQWRESLITGKVTGKMSREEEDKVFEHEDSHGKAKRASYLTPAERKRVAFIKGEFHNEVDTVNAYIVFAHYAASHDTEPTASQALLLHPSEAARLAVEKCDGSLFMNRTIRVDRVGQWRAGVDNGSAVGDDLGQFGDPRATLFVGNLDFAAKEEELRVWFEGVVSQERGPPPSEETGVGVAKDDIEEDITEGAGTQGKPIRWVRSVRIVRDHGSQLGKGFAYVRFLASIMSIIDRECVDEILGLEPSQLKFAKRKLRVQRCKVIPDAPVLPKTKKPIAPAPSQRAKNTASASSVPLPKGDPSLGEKLAGLSKDERKAAKATNVDRLKRRLAKKKLKEGVKKAQDDKAGKERKRERPRPRNKTDGKAKMVNKGRLRSEKSVAKRNTKK